MINRRGFVVVAVWTALLLALPQLRLGPAGAPPDRGDRRDLNLLAPDVLKLDVSE